MPGLRSIKKFGDVDAHVVTLNLDHYDLRRFEGGWSKEQCGKLARQAIDKARAGFRFRDVITYHFFYQEWIDGEGKTIREAELEVGVQ